MATILVAGCGYVGCELARQALDAGHEVIALRRNPDAPEMAAVPAAVRRIRADLLDPATLADLDPGGIDAIGYCLAPATLGPDGYRDAYITGVQNLLAAFGDAGRHRLSRFVLTSSTGVYGQQDGSVVTEESPTEPASDTGRVMVEGEQRLREQLPGVGVSLRLGGIYGPPLTPDARARLVWRLSNQVVDGAIAYDSDAPAWMNLIHRDDAAGAMLHLLTMAEPATGLPPALNGVDLEPPERRALYAFIAEQLQIPLPPSSGELPRGRNKRCSNAALLATGYTFRFPTYRDGMPPLIVDPADEFDPGTM